MKRADLQQISLSIAATPLAYADWQNEYGFGLACIDISNAGGDSFTVELSSDSSRWFGVSVQNLETGLLTATPASGLFGVNLAGVRYMRITNTTGAVVTTVTGRASQHDGPTAADSGQITVTNVKDYIVEVARRQISGSQLYNVFGRNTSVATTGEDIISLGGTYAGFATGSGVVRVVSGNLADDAAGSGAKTVTVVGLSDAGAMLSETVTMDGTTPVDTVGLFSRVWYSYVATSGSGGTNAGQITISSPGLGVTYGRIEIGEARMSAAIFSVPTGYDCLIMSATAGLAIQNATFDQSASVELWVRQGSRSMEIRKQGGISQGGAAVELISTPLYVPAGADIKMRASSTSALVDVWANMDLLLVEL